LGVASYKNQRAKSDDTRDSSPIIRNIYNGLPPHAICKEHYANHYKHINLKQLKKAYLIPPPPSLLEWLFLKSSVFLLLCKILKND
ncbi:hypothetical protein, partial [uncultured Helicobacter sp.]|uniref:hypothetical protein n=1 Tax=uncultured Helicobacter sp. TaxID=175537 RepID=UPI002637F5D2